MEIWIPKSAILDTEFVGSKFDVFCAPSTKILNGILDIFLGVFPAIDFCPDHSMTEEAMYETRHETQQETNKQTALYFMRLGGV